MKPQRKTGFKLLTDMQNISILNEGILHELHLGVTHLPSVDSDSVNHEWTVARPPVIKISKI